MAGEEDAVEIVGLALVPVGTVEQASDAGNRGRLVGVGLDPDARVVTDGQQVVDDLETVVTRGIVGGRDGADLGELSSSVVYVNRESKGQV